MVDRSFIRPKKLLKIIAEYFGLRLNSTFKIKDDENLYRITAKGIFAVVRRRSRVMLKPVDNTVLMKILAEDVVIESDFYDPDIGKEFWTYNDNWAAVCFKLNEKDLNYLVYLNYGLIFRTRLEALNKRDYIFADLTTSDLSLIKLGTVLNQVYFSNFKQDETDGDFSDNILNGEEFFILGSDFIYKYIDSKVCFYSPANVGLYDFLEDPKLEIKMIESKIIKVSRFRFIPVTGEKFYTYDSDWNIKCFVTKEYSLRILVWIRSGLIFRTAREAEMFRPYYYHKLLGKDYCKE